MACAEPYRLIDSHAHLDELDSLNLMLEEAKENGVIAIVAVGSNLESNRRILEISQEYDSFVYPALGLHPWQLANLGSSQINDNLQFIELNIASAYAIGEIGLDYDKRAVKAVPKEMQQDVLRSLLDLAKRYAKPAIIHSRYAWKDALRLVEDGGVDKAVFHWFTGFSSVLRDIVSAGYFISATPATEYHEEHRRAVKETPLNRLFLETDCPVIYGREIRYKSRPVDVLRSLKGVSQLKGLEPSVIAKQTGKNAASFFALDITP
jgi:TatD DNase family protein